MTKKDQEIIDKNPELREQPHELLTKKGLSQQGFDELVAEMDKKASQAAVSSKPRLIPSKILEPITPTFDQAAPVSGQKVRLVPVSGGGLGTVMGRTAAEQTVRRQPGKYRIANI